MSQIEKGAIKLDQERIKRLLIQDQDFDNYLHSNQTEHTYIKNPLDFMEEVFDYYENGGVMQGDALGFPKANSKGIRFQDRQVTIWTGINGHGKSLFLSQVLLHWMTNNDRKVLVISPEMSPKMQIARWVRMTSRSDMPSREAIADFCHMVNGKLYLYDFENAVNRDRIFGASLYATKELGVKHIVIDSLMKIGDLDSEDYGGQRAFLNQLCNLAKDQECHVHLVAHSRKAFSEMDRPNKMDVLGSSNMVNQVDQVLCVWRNKKKEDVDPNLLEEDQQKEYAITPDAEVFVQKNRHGDFEGKLTFWFDLPSLTYRDKP